MSTSVLSPLSACPSGVDAAFSGDNKAAEVVEIGLLLPAEWAGALMELSKKRQESVGQLLRAFIGRALIENNAVV
jgi:hypothetical protein